MNKAIKVLRGEARFLVTGAAPQEALNRLMQANITFWDIRREDELHCSFSTFPKDREKVEALALQAYCKAELLWVKGLKELFTRAKNRPVLLFGLLLSLALSFFLQSYVWVIQVEGADKYHEKEILRALEEEGIGFGSHGRSIDSQELRLKMLSRLPNLSWLAVNRSGAKLTVMLTEREDRNDGEKSIPGNLVAAYEGVITDFTVFEGMRLCENGETVRQGQLLVSGLEDYGIYTKAVRAQGEIYARTWHSGCLIRAASIQEKEYTGREWTQLSVILGNKRINLFGNSGIFHMSCDKMINSYNLAVSGYTFPARFEWVTYREYRTVQRPVSEKLAEETLLMAWQRLLAQKMIAGEILTTNTALTSTEKVYVLSAESNCHEMIARWMPFEQFFQGEDHDRTNYQCRAN